MREALKNGGTMVGGLDPAGIDYAIEESLETIFDLAEEFQVGIDIHLHDTGEVGVYTIDKFLDILEERKFTQRTAISHAFALLDVRPAEKKNYTNAWQRIKRRLCLQFPMILVIYCHQLMCYAKLVYRFI